MQYDKLSSEDAVKRAMEAVKERGVSAEFVQTKEEALNRLKEIIPAGAEIMTAGSTTLEEIGFIELLKSGKHAWNNIKDKLLAEKDPKRQAELRRKSVTSEYYLGSVHAVAETGEIVVASASGSQLPSYTFSSNNIIWVVGTQKITPDLEEAIKRVRTHALPLEDRRMKNL